MAYRACVRAMIKSHRKPSSVDLRRSESCIATSAISLYLKLDGHDGTVEIHSLRHYELDKSVRRGRRLTSPRDR